MLDHTRSANNLAVLLGQAEGLVELGRRAQHEEEVEGEAAARELQERYPVWYSAALAALPDDLREKFTAQYDSTRPTLSPRIKQFVANPRQPWVLYESMPRFLKGHGRWQYAFKRSFEEPLREQRRLLLEAKGRLGVNPDLLRTTEQLVSLFRRLPAALAILERGNRDRAGLEVNDEYDLQRVLHAVLRLHFDDVEAEETTPRRAGGSYRIDFVLRQEKVAIEAKMTRPSLSAKEIRRQLVDDMFGYRRQENVAALVAVVYDPGRRIDNPAGFEQDINTDDSELPVRVVIAQG
ncbi:hypothetical protein [Saccharothrix obliqua]|uniref:PD-(D/E)XK nuclease domain-containing protein n=1 Tax=Saccharothrix obliqua TaxID=2861747 RepID=UPI001C5ED7E5|nr:hypothetical protein [Saccharothrix obliqua]MBW4717301.1 hypothetical protein [Saccharothrix obliqua]